MRLMTGVLLEWRESVLSAWIGVLEVCDSTAAVPVFSLDVPLWIVTVAGVLAIATLMAISGFFSSAEIAMFALPAHRIDLLVEREATNARVVEALREDPHRLLVTILVGNNVANVAMSSVATALLGLYVSGGEAVLFTRNRGESPRL